MELLEGKYSLEWYKFLLQSSDQQLQLFARGVLWLDDYEQPQWNLSVTTTSIIKYITCDLFSNVFQWRLKVSIYSWYQFLPSGAHLGGPWPPRWAPEGREVFHEVVVIDRFHCIKRWYVIYTARLTHWVCVSLLLWSTVEMNVIRLFWNSVYVFRLIIIYEIFPIRWFLTGPQYCIFVFSKTWINVCTVYIGHHGSESETICLTETYMFDIKQPGLLCKKWTQINTI